jgi:hypothetical protein
MTGLVASLWMALQIQGATHCPDAAQVQAQLAPLLPVGFVADTSDVAVLSELAGGAVLSATLRRTMTSSL